MTGFVEKFAWSHLLFGRTPDACYLTDLQGTVIDGNTACEQLSGYSRKELIGRSFVELNLYSTPGVSRAAELLARNAAGESTGPDQFTLHRPDGTAVDVEFRTRPITIDGHQFVLNSARRLSECPVLESSTKYLADRIVETAQAIILVLDTEGRIVRFNPYTEEISGYALGEVQGRDWFETFLPERDVERIRHLFQSAIADIPTRGNINPIVTKDGRERQIEWHDTTLKDREGRILGLLAVGHDITDHLNAEIALRDREAWLESILSAMHECAVVVYDREGRIGALWGNPEMDERYGMRAADAVGSRISALLPHSQAEEFLGQLSHVVDTGEKVLVDLPVTLPKGEFWQRISLAPLRDADGAVTGAVGFHHDITAQWLADETLKDVNEHLEAEVKRRTETLVVANAELQAEIVRRKKAEEEQHLTQSELRREERKLRDILNNMDVFVGLYTTDGVLTFASRAPLEAAGLREEDVLGRPFWETYWWSYSSQVQQQLREALQRAANGETVRYDVPVRVADDRLITIDVTFGPLFDSSGQVTQLLGYALDVSDRKAMEQALTESRTRLEKLVANLPGVVYRCENSPDWPVTFISSGTSAMTGYDPQEFLDRQVDWGDLIHADDRETVWEIVQQGVKQCRTYEITYRIVHRDGSIRWVWERGYGVYDGNSGHLIALEGFIMDITDRRRAEEQSRQHLDALAHVSRVSTMGEMATGLAHELNQPLTAIATYAVASLDGIRKAPDDVARLVPNLEKIKDQALRAGDIIRRIREYVMKERFTQTVCRIEELVKEVASLLTMELTHRGIALDVAIPKEISDIKVDPVQIRQVLLNLLRNSIDSVCANPNGPRRIEVEARERDDDSVAVAVRDSGIGISAEDAPKIFEAFYSSKANGMGMGLAICRTIVEAHGGSIRVIPHQEVGATIEFTVPTHRGERGRWIARRRPDSRQRQAE